MYEHLRNDLMLTLSTNFDVQDLSIILSGLDSVAINYDIFQKETSLMVIDTIPEIVKLYLCSKKLEGLSEKSIELYANRLRIFFETVNKAPNDVTMNDVRMFLALFQMERKVSDRTLDKVRQIIHNFFVWALDEEYISKNPCHNIKKIKFEVKPRKALTRYELETFRRACKTKRETAIVDVLYSTGCRISELCSMKMSDYDVTNDSIHIIGKGRKHNTVYINALAKISLSDYLNSKECSEFIFTQERTQERLSPSAVERLFRSLSERAGFKVTPHILRHTFATLALQSGMPITEVQKCLAHSSVATTQIYAETSQVDVENSHRKYVV